MQTLGAGARRLAHVVRRLANAYGGARLSSASLLLPASFVGCEFVAPWSEAPQWYTLGMA